MSTKLAIIAIVLALGVALLSDPVLAGDYRSGEGQRGVMPASRFLEEEKAPRPRAKAISQEGGTYEAGRTWNPAADFNGDNFVYFEDFLLFADAFGRSKGGENWDSGYDLNGNGTVDFSDFILFAHAFGSHKDADTLLGELSDEDPQIRLAAAGALGRLGNFYAENPDTFTGMMQAIGRKTNLSTIIWDPENIEDPDALFSSLYRNGFREIFLADYLFLGGERGLPLEGLVSVVRAARNAGIERIRLIVEGTEWAYDQQEVGRATYSHLIEKANAVNACLGEEAIVGFGFDVEPHLDPRWDNDLSGYVNLRDEISRMAGEAGFDFIPFTPFWYVFDETEDGMALTGYEPYQGLAYIQSYRDKPFGINSTYDISRESNGTNEHYLGLETTAGQLPHVTYAWEEANIPLHLMGLVYQSMRERADTFRGVYINFENVESLQKTLELWGEPLSSIKKLRGEITVYNAKNDRISGQINIDVESFSSERIILKVDAPEGILNSLAVVALIEDTTWYLQPYDYPLFPIAGDGRVVIDNFRGNFETGHTWILLVDKEEFSKVRLNTFRGDKSYISDWEVEENEALREIIYEGKVI